MTSRDMNLRQGEQVTSPLQIATRHQERFAAGLALLAGYIDAYALINYKTYVSFMSGNTTQTGSQIGQGDIPAALPSLLAIVFFVIGNFAGTLIAYSGLRQPQRVLFGLVATLLAGTLAITQMSVLSNGICIAMLSLAMGLMNTMVSYIGTQSVNIGFVTGTLHTMARHLALMIKHAPLPEAQGEWDTHRRRALLLMGVWASFITGAFLGGLLTTHLGMGTLLFPTLILSSMTVFNHIPK